MPKTLTHDAEFLQAALIGLQHKLNGLDERIADLRSQLGGQPASRQAAATAPASGASKRTMSAAARKRIALAQKKRWAAYNAAKGGTAASKPAKRGIERGGTSAHYRRHQEALGGVP